ncbi:MAG: hypothetical protein Ct9H300mP31_15940 [Acidimicrobiaceae bacterium]|nr:MAG: hypothetical protein Ct9H300mP31_15940 [Acidimicrobiaceae bacterium]
MTRAPFPPSSISTRVMDAAPSAMIRFPTAEDPVKLTILTSGEDTRAAEASTPEEVKTLTTPGGNPASTTASPRRRTPSGSWGAGLMMQVLPIARAGASFPATLTNGKLYDVMQATTPAG